MSDTLDEKTAQYFIALLPPPTILGDAQGFKELFASRYDSKAALNSPPHITLHMPFRWKRGKEQDLIVQLQQWVQRLEPVKICVDNFGAFAPRVIFLNILKSEELATLQKSIERFCKTELNLFNANYKEQPFHPHVTLAFRDLKKAAFAQAWEEFKDKEYKAEFIADKVTLLKHDGKRWNVLKDLPLESSYSTRNEQALETT